MTVALVWVPPTRKNTSASGQPRLYGSSPGRITVFVRAIAGKLLHIGFQKLLEDRRMRSLAIIIYKNNILFSPHLYFHFI